MRKRGGNAPPRALRILHLEDSPNDAMLVEAALRQDEPSCEIVNVSNEKDFIAALEGGGIDLVLSDYALPMFDGITALMITRTKVPDAPFILVSGTLGEEAAIESLRSGATDYVLKHRLNRLVPAVRRALEEAHERRTRRAAEQTLERERSFLRAVLDSLDAGVVACDQNGDLTLFNRATRELHGLPAEPPPPDQWASHYTLCRADGKTPLTAEEIPLRRALRGERFDHAELTVLQRNGVVRTVSTSGRPIVTDRGERLGAVVAMQDVSERKKLERQFHQVQKMEAMGKLAAGVAHDFNNLLTVITGYCQLGLAQLPPSHPAHRDLTEIALAGERAAKLTRQLLAFGRQQLLEPQPLDLNAVIAGIEKMLRRLIGADIDLVFVPGADLGAINVDAGQIEQVVMNLIVNARDAMPQGGRITLATVNLEIDASRVETVTRPGVASLMPEIQPGRYVALAVSDTGCGMDAETVARIFEPFFTTKSADRGTGLGLSTVHGIVTQSGGQIAVNSEKGRGTSFQILFPRATAAKANTERAATLGVPERGTETVLVVDDDGALRVLVSEILEMHGYTVLQAPGGEAALKILDEGRATIHALVTDVIMPTMSGRALAERALAVRPDLATLFVSGFVGDHVEALGALLGPGVAFVQKPFDPETLLSALREVLDARRADAGRSEAA